MRAELRPMLFNRAHDTPMFVPDYSLEHHFSSIIRFCTPFGVPRVVFCAHPRLLMSWAL